MKKKVNSDPVAGFTVEALFCPLLSQMPSADSSSCRNRHIDMQGKGETEIPQPFPSSGTVLQAHVYLRACVFRQDCES